MKKNIRSPKKIGTAVIALFGLLMALDVFALDFYLPAFKSMALFFDTSIGTLQHSLSLFMIGLSIGQIFLGPMSDMMGRMRPLLGGVILFIITSAIIALSTDIRVVLVARVFQGIGAASGHVVPRAIVSDVLSGRQAARAYTFLMLVMSVTPFAAPPIGAILLKFWDWQIVFWVMTFFAIIAFIATMIMVPETNPEESRIEFKFRKIFTPYVQLSRVPKFMCYTLCGGFIYSSLFTFIGGSAFIYMDYYNLDPFKYSLVFAGISFGMLAVGQINMTLLNWFSAGRLLSIGLILHSATAATLMAYIYLGLDDMIIMSSLLFVSISLLSLTFGNIMSYVMNSSPESLKGAASAYLGVMQYAMGSISIMALTHFHDGTLRPLPTVLTLSGLLALFFWLMGMKLNKKDNGEIL